MKYFLYSFLFLFLILSSCSKVNDNTTDDQSNEMNDNGDDGSDGNDGSDGDDGNDGNDGGDPGSPVSIGILNYSIENGYVAQVMHEDGQILSEVNLSDSFGYTSGPLLYSERNYMVIRKADETFYHYAYNFKTNQLSPYENLCGVDVDNSHFRVESTYDDGFVYKANKDQYNIVEIYKEASNGDCELFAIVNENIPPVRSLVVGENYIFVLGSTPPMTKVFVFNKVDGSLYTIIEPTYEVNALAAINDGDELYLIYVTNVVEHYSGPDFDFVSSVRFYHEWYSSNHSDLRHFGDELTQDNKMIIPFPTQDSYPMFRRSPTILNLETGVFESPTNIALLLFKQLQAEYGLMYMTLGLYTGDISKNRLVFTFHDFKTEQRGIAFANFQGEIINSVLLDQVPRFLTLVD